MLGNGMSGLTESRLLAGFLAVLMLLLVMSGPAAALAQAGDAPGGVSAPPSADAVLQPQMHGAPVTPPQQPGPDDLSRPYPLPVLLTIIIATTALVAGLVNVVVTPWTLRRIAADQRRVADKAADAAVTSASAAHENAKAAGKSAEAAVLNATAASRNSVNAGVHQIARLRQEWINDLRNELAALHSLLANWQPPAAKADRTQLEAHEARVRDANTRLVRVEMLLNPRELESRRLVAVLRFLAKHPMALRLRHRRARWIVRWGQVVLKTEWDRVRSELNGAPVGSPRRRTRSKQVLSALPFRKQAGADSPAASPPPASPGTAARRRRPSPAGD